MNRCIDPVDSHCASRPERHGHTSRHEITGRRPSDRNHGDGRAYEAIETLLNETAIDHVLCEQAGIDIEGEYLKLHGARRGLGDAVFRVDRGEAQDLLRHRSLQTTKNAYFYIEAEEHAERVSEILDGVE